MKNNLSESPVSHMVYLFGTVHSFHLSGHFGVLYAYSYLAEDFFYESLL